MTTRSALFAFGFLVLFSTCALADPITFTLSSSLLNANPGQTVTFSATISNPGATNVFLNADNANVAGPLTVDDTKFFLNTPAFLAPGQSVTAQIFDVKVPSNTALGLYSGRFTILGGSSASDLINIGSANF